MRLIIVSVALLLLMPSFAPGESIQLREQRIEPRRFTLAQQPALLAQQGLGV